MNTISVNGRTYTVPSGNISVVNGVVMINGKVVDDQEKGRVMEIKWDGPLANLTCDASVSCQDAMNVVAGGSVNCGNVAGNVNAGGSVNCGNVGGDVDAGGSVCCNKR